MVQKQWKTIKSTAATLKVIVMFKFSAVADAGDSWKQSVEQVLVGCKSSIHRKLFPFAFTYFRYVSNALDGIAVFAVSVATVYISIYMSFVFKCLNKYLCMNDVYMAN